MPINIENAEEALRLLEAQPEEKFDMGYYFRDLRTAVDEEKWQDACAFYSAVNLWNAHPCNTVCCLAGLIQMHKAETEHQQAMDAFLFAQRWLEIGVEDAMNLFMPRRYSGELYHHVSKEQVAMRLRAYIAREREMEPAKE